MADATSVLSWAPARPADMIEANPDNAAEMLIATYLLVEEEGKPQQRLGTVYRMRTCVDDSPSSAAPVHIENVTSLDTTGVFDLKWRPTGGGVWGIAGADGSAHIFNGNAPLTSIELEDNSECCLSIGWRPDGAAITYASQGGEVSLADVESSERTDAWHAHDHEIWVTTWLDEHTFATGSDDCSLKLWDTRVGFDIPVGKRRFDAGVTAITPYRDNTFLVGSYDECVYTFDRSRLKQPLVASSQLGGGIWRVKPAPTDPDTILVAAMHGGGYIVDAAAHEPQTHFAKHESMVYGCEWVGPHTVATCSFYDKIMHFWHTQ